MAAAPLTGSPSGQASSEPDALKGSVPDLTSFDACSTSSGASFLVRRQKKPKDASHLGPVRGWILDHQIGISIAIVVFLACVHFSLPATRGWTTLFFSLSYYNQEANGYDRGPQDFFYVSLWVVLLTALRAAALAHLFVPLANAVGIQKSKSRVRFAEQACQLAYFSVSWIWGMCLMYNSSYWLNLPDLWRDFPLKHISGSFKAYYLVQFAWWLQQILVINIEERRKDHWQMLTHHFVTCSLILCSLGYYETKAGNVLFCLMDIVDLFLPSAKMLKYAGFQTACDAMFGIFIVAWFLARHVSYLMLCWSVWAHVPSIMRYGCYSSTTRELLPHTESYNKPVGGDEILSNILQPFVNPGGPVCYNERIRFAFLGILLVLQGITIMWFTMIIRVAWKVINGQGADDSRSDDEDEEEVEVGMLKEIQEHDITQAQDTRQAATQKPVEQVVGVESLQSLKRRGSPRIRSRKSGHRSGNIIAEHSYVLDRIGCDTKSTD